jgi:tetratricopeptide (TPR) repeat protein
MPCWKSRYLISIYLLTFLCFSPAKIFAESEKKKCDHEYFISHLQSDVRSIPWFRLFTIADWYSSCCSGPCYSNIQPKLDLLQKKSIDLWREIKDARKYWERDGRLGADNLYYFHEFQERFGIQKRILDLDLEISKMRHEYTTTKEYLENWKVKWTHDMWFTGPRVTDEHVRKEVEENAKEIHRVEEDANISFEQLEKVQRKVTDGFASLYACGCLGKNTKRTYDHGILKLITGDTTAAMDLACEVIEMASKDPKSAEFLKADQYFKLGITFSEAKDYSKAIEYLSKAIQLDPANKKAYIERAIAYFETDQLDLALQDYNKIDKEKMFRTGTTEATIQFSGGFVIGAMKGGAVGICEFPASLCNSLRGLGQMAWTGLCSPNEVPQNIYHFISDIIEYFSTQDLSQISKDMAPELYELIKNWKQYGHYIRGEKAGYIGGKYGLEIFATAGSMKAFEAFRKLKRANAACTLRAASTPAGRAAIEQFSEQFTKHREQVFSKAYIKPDCQGKHIPGHRNYETLSIEKKSKYGVLTHSDPSQLLKEYAGKGQSVSEKMTFGKTGYKERVNFGREIGYVIVDPETGAKVPTKWGMIHYDTNGGAHICPINEPKY